MCCAVLRSVEAIEKRRGENKCWTFIFSFLKSGPVQTGRPPPGREGGWESESLRVFNNFNMGPVSETGSRAQRETVGADRAGEISAGPNAWVTQRMVQDRIAWSGGCFCHG